MTTTKTIHSGDLVKIKYQGVKRKGVVLGLQDKITHNCVQQYISTYAPFKYKETLIKCNLRGPWAPTRIEGEHVIDGHSHRVYIALVEPGK